jgi:hypothetical protein
MTASDVAEPRSFFSWYFHEDWELDASKPDEVISQFLRSGPSPNEVDRIVAQIGHYLGGGKDDPAIERGLLEALGCYYLPGADGMSARHWLRHVADLLSKG